MNRCRGRVRPHDQAEMHGLKLRFLLFILLFFFPLFLGGKRKGEKNNPARQDFKSCLSARSAPLTIKFCINTLQTVINY